MFKSHISSWRVRAMAVFGLAGLCGMAQSAVAAEMTYTAQTRTITATASGRTTSDKHSASASDFGHFSAGVSAIIDSDQPNLPSTAVGEQYSWLLPQQIMMSGRVGGKDNWVANGVGGGLGQGVLNTTFTLDAATPYTFDFSLGASAGNSYGYSFNLAGPGGTVFNEFGFSNASNGPDYTGTLQPGSYTLSITVNGGGAGSATTGGISPYSADFSIPEPSAAALASCGLLAAAVRRRRV